MRKKVFVTGAAGFVGSHLVPLLINNGYQVTALAKKSSEKKLITKLAKIVVGDLSRKGSWQKELPGNDYIVHLAAQISSKNKSEFEKNNVDSTKNLIEAAKKAKIKKVILFSSAAVTSIRQDAYAKTKSDQEKILKKSNLNYSILRPSMIYGPGDTKNIGWLIKFIKIMPIIPLPARGEFGRQPVYVNDICEVVLRLLSKNYSQKIFEIHGYEYLTLKRMVSSIIKALKITRVVLSIPVSSLLFSVALQEKILPNPKFTKDQIKSLISKEKFKGDSWWKTFGIIPTRFEAGIREMITKK